MKDDRLLSRLTFITNSGDFISIFVFLKLLETVSGSLTIASFSVGIRALGMAIASASFGTVWAGKSLKKGIIISQGLAGLVTVSMALLAYSNHLTNQTQLVMWAYLCISILDHWFTIARDSYGDHIGETHEKLSVVSQLMSGYFSAQVVGSLLGLILILNFSIHIPLFIDAISFIVAATLGMFLKNDSLQTSPIRFDGFKSILSNDPLRTIFLLRAVAFWIPTTFFNFFRFLFISEHLKLNSVYSAWVDILLGLGGVVTTYFIAKNKKLVESFKYYKLAIFSLVFVGVCRFFMVDPRISFAALFFVFLSGIGVSLNTVSTRGIRAKLTHHLPSETSKIIALETMVGQIVVFLISLICTSLAESGHMDYSYGFRISGLLMIVLAVMHLNKRIRV